MGRRRELATGAASLVALAGLLLGSTQATRSAPVAAQPEARSAADCPRWQPSGTWSSARALSDRGRRSYAPALAVARSGQAIASWAPGVTVAQRPAGGSFGGARRLSARSEEEGAHVSFAGSSPAVAWRDRRRLRLATVRDGETRFRTGDVAVARQTSVALAGGRERSGLLAWSDGSTVRAADISGGGLDRPVLLPATPGLAQPALAAAVDPRGGALVAVGGVSSAGSPAVTILERPPGGSFAAAFSFALPFYAASLRVVRDPGGGAALAWDRDLSRGGTPRLVVEGLVRPRGGPFGAPRQLSGPEVTSAPALASNRDGDAILVWVEREGRVWRLMAAERSAGGDWDTARALLSSRRRPHAPRVALNDRGARAVSFSMACAPRTALLSIARSPGGSWRPSEVMASWSGFTTDSHSLGIDARGRLTELWLRRTRSARGQPERPLVVVASRGPRR
jgi:hypothetical protein